MIRDMQVDPITNQVAHVDFMRIDMAQRIRVKVPSSSRASRTESRRKAECSTSSPARSRGECLPSAIPQSIVVDVTDVHVGQHLEVKDLDAGGCDLNDDPDRVVLSIARAKAEDEATATEAALPPRRSGARGHRQGQEGRGGGVVSDRRLVVGLGNPGPTTVRPVTTSDSSPSSAWRSGSASADRCARSAGRCSSATANVSSASRRPT
ncbi:MAG: hypothetical protein R2862_04785 [Thermoanaerobaculia bacterium]